jgi:hypothetical protein
MKKWKIHQNIFFTKGFNRTLVFDSLLSSIKFIPNDLYDILLSKKFILTEGDVELEYFQFLKDNNYIFSDTVKNLERFTELSNDFSINFDFGICVIELSDITGQNIYKLIENDDEYTRINQFNFIFGDYTTENSILKFVDYIDNYEVDLIELTIIDDFEHVDFLFTLLNNKNRMFVINNFLKKEIDLSNSEHTNRSISSLDIKSLKIYPNLYSYFESKKFNIYFYNKIYINQNSEIKNSNNSDYVFEKLEKIEKINTIKILQDKEFTRYWYSIKEETLVCKDCEFRNLCSDNRIPKLNEDNKWYHENECEYNPYISKWNDEEEYMKLEDSGVVLCSNKIEIDKQKLDSINYELWG